MTAILLEGTDGRPVDLSNLASRNDWTIFTTYRGHW